MPRLGERLYLAADAGPIFDGQGKRVAVVADRRLAPRIVAECDDMALLKALGQEGEGVFVAPHALTDTICRQYGVACLGQIAEVNAQIFLITTERRIAHPAMLAMQEAARLTLFGNDAVPRRRRNDHRS